MQTIVFSFHKKIANKRKLNIVTFGISSGSNIKFLKIEKFGNYFKIKVKIFSESKVFKIRYNYMNYIKNILSTLAVLSILRKTCSLNINFFEDFSIPVGRGNISKIKYKNKNFFLSMKVTIQILYLSQAQFQISVTRQ